MEVRCLEEAGLEHALYGLSLSYGNSSSDRRGVASRLAFRQGGHNKFLESIQVWLEIQAPRYWWQQFDTYRVGTSKQSESTMHTILKRRLSQEDFEGGVDPVILERLNAAIDDRNFHHVKKNLPESFLQRRVVSTNYKVLQSMEIQRRKHKLHEWQFFLDQILQQVEYPEFIKRG